MFEEPILISVERKAVPIIYTRRAGAEPMGVRARLTAAGIGLICLTILLIAAKLHPNPRGYGTHRQLGLAPCAFMERTGLPCPSCGFTTAFSNFAHGNFVASFLGQPMGCVLAMATAVAVWAGFYIAITGRPIHRLFKLLPGRYYLMPVLGFGLLAWGWKIIQTLGARH